MLDFKIVNAVQQQLDPKIFGGGPWIHHATILRRDKEYIVFRHLHSGKLYMEEVVGSQASFELKKIKEDTEWADLYKFCKEAGLLSMSEEVAVGREGLPGWQNANQK